MLQDRWGASTMRFGFTAIPNLLVRINALRETLGSQRITPAEMCVIIVLVSYWIDESSPPFPGINKISHYLSLSPRHVRRIVKSLKLKGYLNITRLGIEGNRRNFYDLSPLVNRLLQSANNLGDAVDRRSQRRVTHMEMAEQMGLLNSSDPMEPALPIIE